MNWNNIETLEKFARFIPYVFIILGFLVAVSGQYFQSKVSERVTELKIQVEMSRKRTPPVFDTKLASSKTGKYYVVIETKNLIPFNASWLLVTENNKVVSGIMLGKEEIYPDHIGQKWQYKVNLKINDVIEDYVELRFDFSSIHSAELNSPEELNGRKTVRYKLANGAPHPLDN